MSEIKEKIQFGRYLNYKNAMRYMDIKSYNTLHKMIVHGLKITETPYGTRIDTNDIDEFMNQFKY